MKPILGTIQIFPFNFAPTGWALCNGMLLSIAQNQPLFSLIGPTYGGNGTTDFALPTLAPLGPEGPSYYIAIHGDYPTR
ncbi:Phage Tail Collar Domain [Rhizobiales bacterium GAS113]|jgi:microcystin-dependent protein|nr:Phage Tail Collar Domain [Rhizobiales bacterium GAS113]